MLWPQHPPASVYGTRVDPRKRARAETEYPAIINMFACISIKFTGKLMLNCLCCSLDGTPQQHQP